MMPAMCDRGVLVVEDDADIREAVAALLRADGYRVTTTANGSDALAALKSGPHPCVVLVDLMLPVMTGWELVSRIRSDAELAQIPVVVTSAASDRSPPGVDRVLRKPLDVDLLVGTVGAYCDRRATPSHSTVRALARRTVEMAELQRLRDELSATIVHDLKSPLSVVLSNLEYTLNDKRPVREEARRQALLDAQSAALRITRLLDNLLDLTRLESGQFLPRRGRVRVSELLEPVLEHHALISRERGVTVHTTVEAGLTLDADADLMLRVIENLFDNARRYTPPGGQIDVRAHTHLRSAQLSVGNTGPTIPRQARARIFEKYGQAERGSGRDHLGLGLYFCRLVLEAHGGTIRYEELPPLSSVFVLELPF
jgi:two-component system sensor histidine kinase/response regulator